MYVSTVYGFLPEINVFVLVHLAMITVGLLTLSVCG